MMQQVSCPAPGGVYCRVPHRRDPDQTGVDEQERMARRHAAGTGVTVADRHVFVDQHRNAWNSDSIRRGWQRALEAVTGRELSFLSICRPGALLSFRPQDAVALLDACDATGTGLLSVGDTWILSDPDARETFRSEAERAARAAAAAGRLARASHRDAAARGLPHGGGRRPYGYKPGMQSLETAEAAIVREVFDRFAAGETLRAIARDLNARAVPNSCGGRWFSGGVARILDAPRYAGLRVYRGEIMRDNNGNYLLAGWQPCISLGHWEQAQGLRAERAAASTAENSRNKRFFLLTGLLTCTICGSHMVGTTVGGYRMYACASANLPVPARCTSHIAALPLEARVQERAVTILESWDTGAVPAYPIATRRDPGKTNRAHADVVVRAADAFDGVVTGSGARLAWRNLAAHRRATVLRCLFTEIRIGQKNTSRAVFDDGRIQVVRDAAITCAQTPA
jgi:DNA invertase Pin-like site-specific DNA recombinase